MRVLYVFNLPILACPSLTWSTEYISLSLVTFSFKGARRFTLSPSQETAADQADVARWSVKTPRSSSGSWLWTSLIWPALTICAIVAPTAVRSRAALGGSRLSCWMSSVSIDALVMSLSGPGGNAYKSGCDSEGSWEMRSFASSGVSRRTSELRTTPRAVAASSTDSKPAFVRSWLSTRR